VDRVSEVETPAADRPDAEEVAGPAPATGAGSADADGGNGDAPRAEVGAGEPRRPPWRERRVLVPAVVAVVSLAIGGGLAWSARDDGSGGGGAAEPIPELPTTTVDAGGIEVDAPDGWTAAPVPYLGFGVAVPPGWEVVVLSEEVLAGLDRSLPAVPGFLDAAHAAAESGALLYAAGADDQDRVTDLKIRAAPESGVEDVDDLTAYGRSLADQGGLADATVEPVEGAPSPTVRIGFSSEATSAQGETVAIEGIETLVLGPRGVVWSAVVTGEVPGLAAKVAPDIVGTLVLAPPTD
jgi:hypothetical protein